MCDTFVFRSEKNNRNPFVWFGKNSDREPNEAHEVIFLKGRTYEPGTTVKCTYIEIPQVESTHNVVLCKPAWMWGAEMGVNSHGVVIGNEALFTRGGAPREEALTGMDLLRLALERSDTAHASMDCIIGLLSRHGQGGNCGFSHPFFYNNSFLIADRNESWVLETIGKEWAARRFSTTTAISNGLTITSEWDESSAGFAGIKNLAAEKSDWIYTTFSQSVKRRGCVLSSLHGMPESADISFAFRVLRSHHGQEDIPMNSLTDNTVCMHAGFGPIRLNQTTGSLIVDLSDESPVLWITGTAAPCLSIFHPILMSDLKNDVCLSSESEWWENEIFHRNMLFCEASERSAFREGRDKLEKDFIKTLRESRDSVSLESMRAKKWNYLQGWRERAISGKKVTGNFLFRKSWEGFNSSANLKIEY